MMNLKQYFKASILLLSVISIELSSVLPAVAVSFPSSTPSSGAPSRTASGAPRRSNCKVYTSYDLDGDGVGNPLTKMTAIAPTNNTISSAGSIFSIFVYIPQNEVDNIEIEVSEIFDTVNPTTGKRLERYQEIYANRTLPVPETTRSGPRIASFSLDDLQLQTGKKYEWSLSLACSGGPVDTVVGQIDCTQGCSEGLKLNNLGHFSNADQILEAAQDYASRAFWNEATYLTAQLRESQPEQWSELLRSQGLDCFIDVPFSQDSTANFAIEDDPQCFVDQDVQ